MVAARVALALAADALLAACEADVDALVALAAASVLDCRAEDALCWALVALPCALVALALAEDADAAALVADVAACDALPDALLAACTAVSRAASSSGVTSPVGPGTGERSSVVKPLAPRILVVISSDLARR